MFVPRFRYPEGVEVLVAVNPADLSKDAYLQPTVTTVSPHPQTKGPENCSTNREATQTTVPFTHPLTAGINESRKRPRLLSRTVNRRGRFSCTVRNVDGRR